MLGIKLWVMLIIAGVLLSTVTVYVISREKAVSRVESLEHLLQEREKKLEEATANAAKNSQSFLECSLVNDENAQEADKQKARADKAVLRLAKLEGQTGIQIGEINREADKVRGKDTACRTLDEPLPEWLVAGLRKPAA